MRGDIAGALCATLAATLWAATPAAAQEPVPASHPAAVIELDAQALARLAASNPNHYARAERILAAANYLCRPRAAELHRARLGAQDLSCARMLLQTSNPPKWRIGFRLDDVRYTAAVVVTDDPPRPLPAR